jgi:hypothetical protein
VSARVEESISLPFFPPSGITTGVDGVDASFLLVVVDDDVTDAEADVGVDAEDLVSVIVICDDDDGNGRPRKNSGTIGGSDCDCDDDCDDDNSDDIDDAIPLPVLPLPCDNSCVSLSLLVS